MKVEVRYAVHPDDFKNYDTERLRKEFLVDNIFNPDEISLVYSMYDRLIVGGVMPVSKQLVLESPDELKSEQFFDRREMGLINIGGEAVIHASGKSIKLDSRRHYILQKDLMMSHLNRLILINRQSFI